MLLLKTIIYIELFLDFGIFKLLKTKLCGEMLIFRGNTFQ